MDTKYTRVSAQGMHLLMSPCSIDTLQVTVQFTNGCMQQSVYQNKTYLWCLMAASGGDIILLLVISL